MSVLVDSSVWIEYFAAKPKLSEASLGFIELLIIDHRVTTIYPIQAELLSGKLNHKTEKGLREAFEIMTHIDLDWNSSATWQEIGDLAQVARKKSLSIPGIVDRMILLAAQKKEAQLWTLDHSLQKLAEAIEVRLF